MRFRKASSASSSFASLTAFFLFLSEVVAAPIFNSNVEQCSPQSDITYYLEKLYIFENLPKVLV